MVRIALLIDAENIPVSLFDQIMHAASPLGALTVRRVFGDFSHQRLADWQIRAVAEGFCVVHEPSAGAGKNSTDIRMTVDAMEIAATRHADQFCIASSDRDFLPLVRRLRETGFAVHGIGRTAFDGRLQKASTSFTLLNESSRKHASANSVPPQGVVQSGRPDPTISTSVLTPREIDTVRKLLRSACSNGPISPSHLGKVLNSEFGDIARRIGGPGLARRLEKLCLARIIVKGADRLIEPADAIRLVK